MKYITITKPDICNGTGCRATLWISGCNHKCKGCHNNMYWEYHVGKDFVIDNLICDLKPIMEKAYIQGLTLSGGDPLDRNDDELDLLRDFLVEFKKNFPTKDIWIFSGDTYEVIKENEHKNAVIEQCDVLVDGEFKKDLKDRALAFRGSSNQRIIDIHNGEDITSQF